MICLHKENGGEEEYTAVHILLVCGWLQKWPQFSSPCSLHKATLQHLLWRGGVYFLPCSHPAGLVSKHGVSTRKPVQILGLKKLPVLPLGPLEPCPSSVWTSPVPPATGWRNTWSVEEPPAAEATWASQPLPPQWLTTSDHALRQDQGCPAQFSSNCLSTELWIHKWVVSASMFGDIFLHSKN